MAWQRCSLRRGHRQPLASHHVPSDVRDRGGRVLARKRRRKRLRRGRRGKPPESSYCARIQATATSGGKQPRKSRERVRFDGVQRLFEEFVGQLEVRIKEGDQAGFYKHLKGTDLEGRRSCSVQNIKEEEGRLLRDMGLIRASLGTAVQPFYSLLLYVASARPEHRRRAQGVLPVHTSRWFIFNLVGGGSHQEHVKPIDCWTR